MSKYHFARRFRQVTGKSPHAYVVNHRVERAKQLLQAGCMTIAMVAFATGFASQSHLTAKFKQRVGSTPAQYQRQVLTSQTR